MISRRLLRIKALLVLYAFFKNGAGSIQNAEKELFHSINKVEEMYYMLFLLIVEVRNFGENKIEKARQKQIATAEDLHPNTSFTDNKVINQINESSGFHKYLKTSKITWINYPELVKNLYNELIETDFYKEYIKLDTIEYKDDKELVNFFFSEILYNSKELYGVFEEQSVYWNDDADFVIGMVVKTIKEFKENRPESVRYYPVFQKEEDSDFVKHLFRKTLINHVDYRNIIEKQLENWDVERIAYTDKLILMMAVAEMMEFSSIPVNVTFNEYIEIARKYGSEKSSAFINGVLDKMIQELKIEGKIIKTGRGLVE